MMKFRKDTQRALNLALARQTRSRALNSYSAGRVGCLSGMYYVLCIMYYYYSIKGFWSNGTSLIKVIKIFYRSNCVAPFIIILSIR